MGEPLARLTDQRERKGLSQADLSRLSGISRGQIANLESGARDLTLDMARRLAKGLNLTVGDILPLSDVPNQPTERDLEVLRAFDHLDDADREMAAQIAVDLVRMVRNVAARGALEGRSADRLASIWNGLNEERRQWALNVLEGAR